MTYPTMPPWCNQPQTFPPICPPAGGAGGGGQVGAATPPMMLSPWTIPPQCGVPPATYPPDCGGAAPAAAQMPTIYPAYTCGFVCNTAYPPCGTQQEWGGGGAQAGAAQAITFTGHSCPILACQNTIFGRTCPQFHCPPTFVGHTCPIQQCGPTLSGHTCPTIRCFPTLQGITCPEWQCPQPTLATQSCDTFRCAAPTMLCTADAVGAPALAPPPMGGGIQPTLTANTCLAIACQPTLFSATCPVCPPTLTGVTCPIAACHPTLFGRTCPQWQCPPTLVGHTCPVFVCRPQTLFNRTCPQQLCHTTLNPICVIQPPILLPGPQQQQQQVGFRGGVQTVVGDTCPFFQCVPTLSGASCPPDLCPIPTVNDPQCFPSFPGEICQFPAGGGGGQQVGAPGTTFTSPACFQPVTLSSPACFQPVTLSGKSCWFFCPKPTLFGKSCPIIQCAHTIFQTTCVCKWPVQF